MLSDHETKRQYFLSKAKTIGTNSTHFRIDIGLSTARSVDGL